MSHALWSWRNQEGHNENYVGPLYPIIHILKRNKDYKQAMKLYKTIREEGSGNKFSGWIPLTRSVNKLNVNGANKIYNVAGCEGVLRDHKRKWKGGFSKYVGSSSALLAELWGVF